MQKELVITHNSAKLHLEYDVPYLVRGEQTHTGWKNWWLIPLVTLMAFEKTEGIFCKVPKRLPNAPKSLHLVLHREEKCIRSRISKAWLVRIRGFLGQKACGAT